jgi:hypothetical protein
MNLLVNRPDLELIRHCPNQTKAIQYEYCLDLINQISQIVRSHKTRMNSNLIRLPLCCFDLCGCMAVAYPSWKLGETQLLFHFTVSSPSPTTYHLPKIGSDDSTWILRPPPDRHSVYGFIALKIIRPGFY